MAAAAPLLVFLVEMQRGLDLIAAPISLEWIGLRPRFRVRARERRFDRLNVVARDRRGALHFTERAHPIGLHAPLPMSGSPPPIRGDAAAHLHAEQPSGNGEWRRNDGLRTRRSRTVR